MVRPLSAIARVTAWRIHQVAYVENLKPRRWSNFSTARIEAERSLLDQVEERQSSAQVALRDRDDEAQVGLDHLLLGDHVAALDPLGEVDLLLGRQQADSADRAQVEPQRVEARLDRQVDLRALRRRSAARVRPFPLGVAGGRHRGLAVGLDHVDAVLLQVRMQLLHLLLRDLHLLQGGSDLLERQVAALLTFGDQLTELLHLRDRSLVRQQNCSLLPHDFARSSSRRDSDRAHVWPRRPPSPQCTS